MAINQTVPSVSGLISKNPHNTAFSQFIDNDIDLQTQITSHLDSTTAHDASEINNDSMVSGAKVSDALNTNNQSLISHVSSTSAHGSSSVNNESEVSGLKVSDALNTTKTKVDAHVAGTADKHGSDAINNQSSVVGTSVSTALNTVQQQVNALVVGGTTNTTIGVYSLTAGGSVNAYTGTFSGLTLFGGLKINATFNTVNTGASTFNLNALGVKTIKVVLATDGKSDLKGGELYGKVLMEYDGTDFVVVEKNFLNGGTSSTPSTVHQPITTLPSTVIKGRADWKVEGNTLTNAVVNGDFAAGTTGWTTIGSTISALNKTLTITGDGTSASARTVKLSVLNNNTKYFLKMRARVTNAVCSSLRIGTNLTTAISINTPVQNQRYDVYSIFTTTTDTDLRPQHVYADAATANGKIMEIDGNVGVFAIPLTGTPYESFTADQMNALVTTYFEGTQGTKDVRVKMVGKNLFDGQLELGRYNFVVGEVLSKSSSDGIRVRNKFKVKANTAYTVQGFLTTGDFGTFNVLELDSDNRIVKLNQFLSSNQIRNFTTLSNTKYLVFYQGATGKVYTDKLDTKYMINEDSTSLPYEPYTETEAYLPVTLNSVPNGTKDSVDDKGVFVKRVQEYTLVAGDIYAYVTTGINIDEVRISNGTFNTMFGWGTVDSLSTKLMTQVSTPRNNIAPDTIEIIGRHYLSASDIRIAVAKGTYANLAAAQTALVGTKIYYELATPITTQLPINNLIAEPSGTMYVDNIFSDVALYGANITVAGRTFNAIEKVLKIDKDTGEETDVTSTCTLRAGKDGFTSTALVSGDLVWFALESTNTTLASLTYSYPMDIKASIEGNTKAIQQVDKQLSSMQDYIYNPTDIVALTTGFLANWSGTLRYAKNREGLVTVYAKLLRSADILSTAEILSTLPLGYRPVNIQSATVNLLSSTDVSIASSFANITINSSGQFTILPVTSTTLTNSRSIIVTFNYYSA